MLRGPMTEARTERVSPRKLAAMGDGKPFSRALCGAAGLAALGLAVNWTAIGPALQPGFDAAFAAASAPSPVLDASVVSAAFARALGAVLAPVLGAIVLGVLAIGVLQVATIALPAARGERRSRFDLGARIGQLFAPERVLDGAIAAAMLTVLGAVAWLTLAESARGVLALSASEPAVAARDLLALFGALAARLVVAGLALGALDYLQRRVRHAHGLRMTPRELRDEQREQYGDPSVRAERARRMRP